MMQFTLRSDALYGIRLISFTKIDKWSILVKEMSLGAMLMKMVIFL